MIEPSSVDYRLATRALALGSMLAFGNLYFFQSLLPLLLVEFDVSATLANWVSAASTLGLAIGLLPCALYSERMGRRPILLASLVLLPICGLLGALADSLWMLALMRFITGLILAGFIAVAIAYMTDEFSPVALALAVGAYVSANSLGGIGGRLYGGIFGDWFGWRWAMLGLAVITALGTWWVWKTLPSARRFVGNRESWREDFKAVFGHIATPNLWLAMIVGGFNFALFVNQFSVMGLRLVDAPHNLPVAVVSLIFLCYLSGTVTSRLSGRWDLRYGALSGMLFGVLLSIIGMKVADFEHIGLILLGLLLISGGAFLTHALAYSWVSQNALKAKASASALYLIHYYVGGSLGGFWLLWCYEQGGWEQVMLGSLLCYLMILMAVVGLYRLQAKNRRFALK